MDNLTVNDIMERRSPKQPYPYFRCDVKCNYCNNYIQHTYWKTIKINSDNLKPGQPIPQKSFECAVCKTPNRFRKEIYFR